MRIDVARMDADGEDFEGEDPVEVLDWNPEDDLVVPSAPVRYQLRAEIVGQELLVRGWVATRFAGTCCRCGGPLDIEIRDDGFCASIELPDDVQEVDLTPELRESILLALPSHPVCRPDCRGVCPRCGRQLAGDGCGCADLTAPGWAALSSLDASATGAGREKDAP